MENTLNKVNQIVDVINQGILDTESLDSDFDTRDKVREAIYTHLLNSSENLSLSKIFFEALDRPLSEFIYESLFRYSQFTFLWNEVERARKLKGISE